MCQIVTLLECCDDCGRSAAENHLTTGLTLNSTSVADVIVIVVVGVIIVSP